MQKAKEEIAQKLHTFPAYNLKHFSTHCSFTSAK